MACLLRLCGIRKKHNDFEILDYTPKTKKKTKSYSIWLKIFPCFRKSSRADSTDLSTMNIQKTDPGDVKDFSPLLPNYMRKVPKDYAASTFTPQKSEEMPKSIKQIRSIFGEAREQLDSTNMRLKIFNEAVYERVKNKQIEGLQDEDIKVILMLCANIQEILNVNQNIEQTIVEQMEEISDEEDDLRTIAKVNILIANLHSNKMDLENAFILTPFLYNAFNKIFTKLDLKIQTSLSESLPEGETLSLPALAAKGLQFLPQLKLILVNLKKNIQKNDLKRVQMCHLDEVLNAIEHLICKQQIYVNCFDLEELMNANILHFDYFIEIRNNSPATDIKDKTIVKHLFKIIKDIELYKTSIQDISALTEDLATEPEEVASYAAGLVAKINFKRLIKIEKDLAAFEELLNKENKDNKTRVANTFKKLGTKDTVFYENFKKLRENFQSLKKDQLDSYESFHKCLTKLGDLEGASKWENIVQKNRKYLET